MTRIPVVQSKLTMPHLPDSIIVSERIKKLTAAMQKKNAVIITAPSGYGKTTLIISSLSSRREKTSRICWYRMEPEDRDLSIFYAYLLEALFPNEDPQWEEARQMLENFADYQSHYRYINAILCQELWAYCNRHQDKKTFIVFDDFQQVKDIPEIAETLAYLICNLPANCAVLISSRQQVEILTEKQKLEKSILEINQNDLCFIEEEISTLLIKTYQINTGKELMQRILNSTEGWIAGVIMLCRILSDSGTVSESSLPEKPWQKTKFFSYMASEVFKTIDSDMLQFLVKTAALKDFTIEEAENILGIANVSYFVSQCEKKGLFIQKIIRDDITYRFHSLFRDALIQFQHEHISIEEIKAINFKAAAYYIEHKIFGRAIEHFIICGDMDSAVKLITKEIITLMTFEAIQELRVWFNFLPEKIVEQNPALLYIKSFTYQQSKDNQMIPLMEKALVKYKEMNDSIMQIYTLMALIHYHIYTNDIDNALHAVSQALHIIKSDGGIHAKHIRQIFLFIRAIFEEKYSRAMVFSKYLGSCEMDEDWKWVVQKFSCMLGSLTGELDYAERSITDGFESKLAKKSEFHKALGLTYYCTALHLKNDAASLTSAENLLTTLGEKYEYNFMLGVGKRASAYKYYAMHDTESALELLDTSTHHFELCGNKAMAEINRLSRLIWLSNRKSPTELLSEAKRAFKSISTIHSGFCLMEIGRSIIGAIARECGEYRLAEEQLLASVIASEKKGAKQVLCGSYLHLAKLYYDMKKQEAAEDYLRKAFSLAFANRYFMFWDIHMLTLTEMSVRGIQSGIYAEYAKELIAAYFKHAAVIYIERNISMIDDASISDFSESIISKFKADDDEAFPFSIDIRLLGRFTIEVNGVTVPEQEWKTKKIKGILEYLILHKGRAISRDQLMEVFWSDSDKKSAAVSLRAALYELKKVLAKYGIKNDGYAPFILEKAGSLEIKANNKLTIDTDILLSLHNQYKQEQKRDADKKQQLIILERINSLYTEDLLCEEIYSDWTFADREAYKSIFLEAVTALASLYIEAKESKPAEKLLLKVLSIDPYNEEVCFMLLKLYLSENQRSRAAKLYSDFEKRLVKDLNIVPDKKLSQIIKNHASQ